MSEFRNDKVDLLKKTIDRTTIIYRGVELTREEFLCGYVKYLEECMFVEKHNILITQHNGSEIYDALMISVIALTLLTMNSMIPEDIIQALEKGQIVTISDKERMEYLGKSDTDSYYHFRRESKEELLVKAKKFSQIIPYYGNAKELGKRGTGVQHSSYIFQKDVFGYDDNQATSFVNTSVVIVADHRYFDRLLDGIIIKVDDNEYSISNLLGVSFFTDETETVYPGNANRLEANIKVARTMSTARNLLFNPENNEIIGFCAFGLSGLKNTVGELEDALKRKKIAFSAVNYNISEDENSLFGLMLEDNLPEFKLYSCTKEFLLAYYFGVSTDKALLKEFHVLNKRIINKRIDFKILPDVIEWEELIRMYRILGDLRKQADNNDELLKFVIQAYALLRLMLSSIVPLKEFINKEDIKVEYITPAEKINELKAFTLVPGSLSQYTGVIVECIEKLYVQLFDNNPKADFLCKTISRDKRTVIVTDRAYYRPIIKRYFAKRGLHNSFTANTESKARDIICDELYVVGKRDNNNIFNWNTAGEQVYLLYAGEYNLFAWSLKQYLSKISMFNKWSFYEINTEEIEDEGIKETEETINEAMAEIDSIEELEQSFMIQSAILHSSNFTGEANTIPAEITRVAVCETGESIYFTKYFKALVLDIEARQVKEEDTKNIRSGDSIIFTINNGQTKDIAELVLSKFARNRNNEQLISAMSDVKDWKEHLNLIRDEKKYTYNQMCGLFKKNGYNVTSQAVRSWLDSDCHVVGPKNDEAYYAMAKIFEAEGMLDEFVKNPKKYIESTRLVRNQRTKILDVIADVIVAKYTGKEIKLDKSFDGVITEEITELSVLKRIARIQDVEIFTVPNSKANKPIVM